MPLKVKSALISVSDKTGLDKFVKALDQNSVNIISTGGTAKFIKSLKVKVIDISEYTGFPEIMDGRVKTLHPKVHGGLLAVRSDKKHKKSMHEHGIEEIDMVVVNLYPFEETVKAGKKFAECIENIDIGGPSMIRSAAKNHKFVAVVTDVSDYEKIMKEMAKNSGHISDETLKQLAAKAFARTASYDAAIAGWFAKQENIEFQNFSGVSGKLKEILRYGENPHQRAAIYVANGSGIAGAEQLQGKELSYNNIADADAAYELVNEFRDPAVAIIKHANPCGVALGKNLSDAYEKALASDPVSAYGGIVAFNDELDKAAAEKVSKLFVEVIIAPAISSAAKEILAQKKNLRVLIAKPGKEKSRQIKNISGGFLIQDSDGIIVNEKDLKIVTRRKPTKPELKEMIFAFTVCKHVKSNAIVFSKNNSSIGIGAGQMSRVDSVKIAAMKIEEITKRRHTELTVASDAFFPFADGLIAAAKAGATYVIQPGGSIRDEEVIRAADERNMVMVFTNIRHFKH